MSTSTGFDIDAFDFLLSTFQPQIVMTSISPASYYVMNGPMYKDTLQKFAPLMGDGFFELMLRLSPSMKERTPPAIYFAGKASSKKNGQRFYLLKGNMELVTFNPITGETTVDSRLQTFNKSKDKIVFHFADKEVAIAVDGDLNAIYDLVAELAEKTQRQAYDILLDCFEASPEPPAKFAALNQHVISIFRQVDFGPIRRSFMPPFDSETKRTFANSIVKFFAFEDTLCFYLNSLIAFYFMDPPSPPELFRADSLLTNSFAALRDIYSTHFFRATAECLAAGITNFNTTEEILQHFLSTMKVISVPGLLRWLCWLIYHEARAAFPEGDAPFYAVSGFFFLRGLGPMLAIIENIQARKKCMMISKLINFSQAPEIQPFIPKFKELIGQISLEVDGFEFSNSDMFQRLKPEQLQQAAEDMTKLLFTNAKNLKKYIATSQPIGIHPIKWFIQRVFEQVEKEK